MAKSNGAIIWQGKSKIDNRTDIVVILTGLAKKSANRKTGDMVQAWILVDNMLPTVAVKSGVDKAICGDCPHRGLPGVKGRSCYVNVGQGPQAVYRAYKRGSYPVVKSSDIGSLVWGRKVRFGAYGDPAAAPAVLWETLADHAESHTGYTHQWQATCGQGLKGLVQASADSKAEAARAHSWGWRTFRVTHSADDRLPTERVCPAESMGLTCERCRACNGSKLNVTITVHGSGKKHFQDAT